MTRGRGDWREWRWDPTLFEGAAVYYERGRRPYAEGLAAGLRGALDLDGSGRLLDVGCGPGTITLRVAHLFEQVVGVDADQGMLVEAARLAFERGIRNTTWLHNRAEDVDPDAIGRFRVITFGASFHWMDRPLVAGIARGLVENGGALVHVDSGHQNLPARDELAAVRRAYLGPDRRAGRSIRNNSPDDEDDVFRAAGFDGPHITVVPDGRVIERTIDDLIAESFSTSFGAPHLFGERLADFERDARAALEAAIPSGRVTVSLPDNLLKVWRPV